MPYPKISGGTLSCNSQPAAQTQIIVPGIPASFLKGNIHPSGYIDSTLCDVFYSVECLNPEYITHRGDVVIRLTTPYTAVQITEDLEGYVIPSSFVVVRADNSVLLPDYLVWLLNSQTIKQRIYESAVSNALGAVKPRYFAEYELEELPISYQRTLADLSQMARRETQLLLKLATEKEKYYDLMINQVFTEMKRG